MKKAILCAALATFAVASFANDCTTLRFGIAPTLASFESKALGGKLVGHAIADMLKDAMSQKLEEKYFSFDLDGGRPPNGAPGSGHALRAFLETLA